MAIARQVTQETVRGVEGIVLQKPIHVYLLEFTDAGRIVRVMWWINSVNAMFPMLDRVNSALEEALLANGITIACTTYNVRLRGVRPARRLFSPTG